MPFVRHSAPFWKECGLIEFPIYYMDHHALLTGAGGFEVGALDLDNPGVRVFDFHPHLVLVNACEQADYDRLKTYYRDRGAMLAARRPGKGVQTLLLGLLDQVRRRGLRTATLRELNAEIRVATEAVVPQQEVRDAAL